MIKRRIRSLIARVAPAASSSGVRVLMYHDIGDPDPRDRMALRVSPTRFVEQMTALRDDGCRVVPLSSVGDPPHVHGGRSVAITFDDGYRSHAWAAGVLRDFGFTATFFVVPRLLDGGHRAEPYWESWGHLDWEQLSMLAEQGFEVGAHSMTHPDLTTCSGARLDDEASGARARIEERVGRPVRSFSYPFGRHDRLVRQAVERAGYALACTSRYGINHGSGRLYAVHRTEVGGADDLMTFRSKLRGKFDWLGYWQDLTSWREPRNPTNVDPS